MSRRRRWSDDDLKEAVASSRSLAQVIFKLGLAVAGGTYSNIQKHIDRLQLDISHFKGQGWNGNNYRQPLEELLVTNSSHYDSCSLKKRLFQESLLTEECYKCGLGPVWENALLCLQLEHKNGIKHDNRLENLEILCPNCHTQTKTWGSKNKR